MKVRLHSRGALATRSATPLIPRCPIDVSGYRLPEEREVKPEALVLEDV